MSISNILFLDTETTGLQDGRLVQLAFKKRGDSSTFVEYYKPPIPIEIGAMATHHITEKKVADKLAFNESEIYKKLPALLSKFIIVAHNAKFDLDILSREGIQAGDYICTYKVASTLYEYPNHKMQYLRYAFGIDLEEAVAHDAEGDVLVLEKVFEYMLAEYSNTHGISELETIKKFVEISAKPTLLRTLTFGKHSGKTFSEIKATEPSYLEWLATLHDKGEDFKFTVQYYLSHKPTGN